jgi:hypothetical protein
MLRARPAWILAAALSACGDAPPAPAKGDPWSPRIEDTSPTGAPVRVAKSPAAGTSYRTKGTFSHRRVFTGTRFGDKFPGGAPPPVDERGTFEARWRVEKGPEGDLGTVLDGTIALAGATSPTPAEAKRISLRFRHDPKGGAVHRTIRFEAPGLAEGLEALAGGFTDPFGFPSGEARVGERFLPEDVFGLEEPLKRTLHFLFLRRAQAGQSAVAPIEGRAWVEARERVRGVDVLRTRLVAVHRFEGDMDPPPATKDDVRIAYLAVVEGTVRWAVDGGYAATFEQARRRRISFRARDLDYQVESESRAAFETTRDGP